MRRRRGTGRIVPYRSTSHHARARLATNPQHVLATAAPRGRSGLAASPGPAGVPAWCRSSVRRAGRSVDAAPRAWSREPALLHVVVEELVELGIGHGALEAFERAVL